MVSNARTNRNKIPTKCSSVEVFNVFSKDGIFKVLGTAVCVFGAVLMVFYRGPSLIGLAGINAESGNALAGATSWSGSTTYPAQRLTPSMVQFDLGTWNLGVLCLIGNCFLMGAYLVIQVGQIGMHLLNNIPGTLQLSLISSSYCSKKKTDLVSCSDVADSRPRC